MFKTSPRTTALGAIACLLSLASIFTGVPIPIDVIGTLAAGVGLIFAKDDTK